MLLFADRGTNLQPTVNIMVSVHDSSQEPIAYAVVVCKTSDLYALTDEGGNCKLADIQPGEHLVTVSALGFITQEIAVTVMGNDTKNLKINLPEYTQQLQTVEITGRKETQYTNTLSFIGTKTALPVRETPQSISNVTKELMQDQAATRISEVIRNVSGVNMYTFFDDVTIRGFRNQGSASNQLFNGLRTFNGYWRQAILNYLERVEIIKGPASALYGNTSPGGTINKVTKKPLDQPFHSISYTMGSFNTNRLLVDLTGPANKARTVLYRANVEYEDRKSFRDLIFDKNIVLAPSLSYLPSASTRLNVDLVYNRSKSRMDRGQAILGDKGLSSTPITQTVGEVNDYLREHIYMLTSSFTHRFSEAVAFNASYLRTGYIQDVFEHRSNNAYAKNKLGQDVPSLLYRQANWRHIEQFNDSFTAYFNFAFSTSNIRHKLVAGYDYANSKIPPGSSQSNASGYLLADGSVASQYVVKDSAKYIFYNYNGQMLPKPNTPSFDLAANRHGLQDIGKYVYTPTYNGVTVPVFSAVQGLYFHDQLQLGRLQMLLGLRWDTYSDKLDYKTARQRKVRQHILLPRVGLVYPISPNINAYATYATGYNPQEALVQSSPTSGGPFPSVRSRLLEAGIKSDWFDKELSITGSVYHILQYNTLYSANSPDNPDLMQQIGKDRAAGVELEITGNLLPNWKLVLVYAHNRATIFEGNYSTDSGIATGFEQKPNAPRHQGNLWTKYDFRPGTPLKGFGLALGANYVGKRLFGRHRPGTAITGLTGPAYLLVNAGAFYRIQRVQLQVNLNNIFNRTHWIGGYDNYRVHPGAPFNWQTTIRYHF
ncbi:MAG: hypothetical protein BGO21_05335 [Dyadobacter sp. 50-39]|nr:MAG: hypothetical protein BGO21_05335 [Dyadobacter sp. 50-39]